MTVLIVEDDPRIGALLERGLKREGHLTTLAVDGPEGLDLARSSSFDIIILDVMLPRLNGYEVSKRLRSKGCETPILMLTARARSSDIVEGLDTGADDYLTKPFSFDELMARLRALARRQGAGRSPVMHVGDLSLDPSTREVRRGARRVELTRREFQLLELLMRRSGTVLPRETMIESVWGHEVDIETNTLDVFVSSLRRKIHGDADSLLIHTVRGVGFCLRLEQA